MKTKNKSNYLKEGGITLIALVVTIVVLLILAGVSVNALFGNSGIIEKAKEAQNAMDKAKENDEKGINELTNWIDNQVNGTEKENKDTETISKNTSYVGCYADINGDGTVEGIIYADLAVGGNGQWKDGNGAFSYEAITGIKDYYISKTDYVGKFKKGKTNVISLVEDSKGADRFFVMALEDFDSSYNWYNEAYSSEESLSTSMTSTEFGAGKKNTSNIINNVYGKGSYGATGESDMWNVIQDKVKEGWFVPSRGEWAAFANNLEITMLDDFFYWSSSLYSDKSAWRCDFDDCGMGTTILIDSCSVRLSVTF